MERVLFPFQKRESVFSHDKADTDESKQTNKKLHFHGNYWQLRGALLLVSEVPCLAKVMPAPGCHWRGPEVSTHHRQVGRGCRVGHGAASASGRTPLLRQESCKGWRAATATGIAGVQEPRLGSAGRRTRQQEPFVAYCKI